MKAPEVYVATLRDERGRVFSVPFLALDRPQVFYACCEIYPDSRVLSVVRDVQWDGDDRAADRDAAPRQGGGTIHHG